MAKRFTNTDRWKTPLLKGLQAPYKLLWTYLNDECDHAGIWIVDWEVAIIRTGLSKITFESAKEALKDHIVDLGDEWFLPSFIRDQYNGALSEENKVHGSVLKILREKNIDSSTLKKEAPCKPLASPLRGAKDMDKEKNKDSSKVDKPVIYPFNSDEFSESWQGWKDYKKTHFKFSYKSPESEQAALIELSNLSGGKEETALLIIRQSVAQGWKGFFKLTDENNGQSTSKKPTTGSVLNASYKRKLAESMAADTGGSTFHGS